MTFFDSYSDWCESEDGEASREAMDDVNAALVDATVDADDMKIIWSDGERLTIDETVTKIEYQSDVPSELIKIHVILWLQMEYVPKNLNEEQMELFESKIDNWISTCHSSRRG